MKNVCWQYIIKQITSRENREYIPENLRSFVFKEVSYNIASEFIKKYEWVGNMGTSKYCYGLFFESQIGGVVCFGPCIAPSKYSKIFGEKCREKIIQLTRGATNYWAPKWCASKLISLALSYIRKNTPFRIVIAYADPAAGEIGTIYQASNAYYFGMTNPGGSKKYIINKHVYDARKVVAKFGSRSKKHISCIDPDFKTISINPKHRYVFILSKGTERKKIIKRISHLILQYPKRSNCSHFQQVQSVSN